jgi:hypothetical protein
MEMYERLASFVDKILRGRKPADLPVQQPTKFELVVDLAIRNYQAAELALREIDPTARALKLQVQWFDVAKVEDFDGQFQAITKWRPRGLVVRDGPLMVRHIFRSVSKTSKGMSPAF